MNGKQLLALLRAAVVLGALFAVVFSLGCASTEPESGAALPGTSWVLSSYGDGNGGLVSVLEDTRVSIAFSDNGDLAGLAGCNSYWGTYATEDDELSIESLDSTSLSCTEPAGVMEQEKACLQALRDAATFEIEGDTLELRSDDGSLLASYDAWNLPPGG